MTDKVTPLGAEIVEGLVSEFMASPDRPKYYYGSNGVPRSLAKFADDDERAFAETTCILTAVDSDA